MCGISGIIAKRKSLTKDDIEILQQMNNILRHRGKDGTGTFTNNEVALAHRRLAIIDIKQGQQPIFSEDNRYVLVFNGEIYNYHELKQQLIALGFHFQSQSDSEVLLKALIYYKAEVFTKLNGMFAFLFYDTITQEWIAARDHFGIKPFYYTLSQKTGNFIFASEIKALLIHPDISPTVSYKGLDQYLTFQYCLNETTLFNGIKKIQPGHFLLGKENYILKEQKYWDINYCLDEDHSYGYFTEKLEYLLTDSIQLQTRSDVPLGVYLSGGIDSSAIACLAKGQINNLNAFTGKFNLSPQYDESNYAREVAYQCRAILYEVNPTTQDFIDSIENIIWSLDEPVAGPGSFPQFMVSRLASKHVKVILGGQGGDEIFGGYARYLVAYFEQALKGAIFETQEEGQHIVSLRSIIPNLPVLKQYIPLLKNFWKEGLFESMDKRYFNIINRSSDMITILNEDVSRIFQPENTFQTYQQIFNKNDTLSYINKMTYFDLKTLLPALLQIEDRASMSFSMEARVPFLDHRICELMGSIPPAMKFYGGRLKGILKDVLKNKIPDSILLRKDKMGFPVPLTEWLQDKKYKNFLQDVLLSRTCLERGIFHTKTIQDLFDNPGVGARKLWGALSLELWFQKFIDKQHNFTNHIRATEILETI